MAKPETSRAPAPAGGRSRLIWRKSGTTLRAYADLREFGKGRVALKPPGESRATTDRAVARELLRKLLNKITRERRDQVLLGLNPEADLSEYAVQHLQAKAVSGGYSAQWLAAEENHLARAVEYFCGRQHATEDDPEPAPIARNLAAISVRDVRGFSEWLKTVPNGRGGFLGAQSRLHHLGSLSNVFARAISEGLLKMGRNPVAALLEKPKAPKSKTDWLEIGELALLLESARIITGDPRQPGRRPPLCCVYEYLATFALTGAREDEVRRLNVEDVHFEYDSIDVRGTKTDQSDRSVPLHPQLREILLPYVEKLGRASGPLFLTEAGERVGDWRKTLDAVANRAGITRTVRTKMFRTSYITHRLSCIDNGAPMEPYQVAREVGHSDLAMIMRVYGRVQRSRLRLQEMAYRVESIGPALRGRLAALHQPPADPDAVRRARWTKVVDELFREAEGESLPALAVASGISEATLERLRAGEGAYLHPKTRARIEALIERRRSEGAVPDTDQDSASEAASAAAHAELVGEFLRLTEGMTAGEVRQATGMGESTIYRMRRGETGSIYRPTMERIRIYVEERKR